MKLTVVQMVAGKKMNLYRKRMTYKIFEREKLSIKKELGKHFNLPVVTTNDVFIIILIVCSRFLYMFFYM
jgi:hypothetical protein